MTEVIKLTARCVKCFKVLELEIPAFQERLDYAASIAAKMQRPGVVILCDDCTPKTEATA